MRKLLFDTGPLSLYFADHEESKKLIKSCTEANNIGFVPSKVLLEFYYLQWRQFGQRISTYRFETIINSELRIVDLEMDQFGVAAKLKATDTQFSLVDSIVLALAQHLGARIITTEDRLSSLKSVKTTKVRY